jgi:hypothetical protein
MSVQSRYERERKHTIVQSKDGIWMSGKEIIVWNLALCWSGTNRVFGASQNINFLLFSTQQLEYLFEVPED